MNTKLVPVLSISTNETGSHRTLYAVGTRADCLVHDYADGKPTYAEGVFVEMVPESLAEKVRECGSKGMHFSDSSQFHEWLIEG